MQNVDSYLSFNHQSFSRFLKELYEGSKGRRRIIRSLNDRLYAESLNYIEDYIGLMVKCTPEGGHNALFFIPLEVIIML